MKSASFHRYLCAAFALAALAARADDLTWHTDLAKAQALAKSGHKSVLLYFHGSDWCPPCIEMQRNVIQSGAFIDYARQSLVLVDVDFPEKSAQPADLKRANLALKAKFNVGDNYPTLVLLDDSGQTLFQEAGYFGGGPGEVLPKLQRHTAVASPSAAGAAYKNVNVEEFAALVADKSNIILDVRTSQEFQAGHLDGALNMDVNSPDFPSRVASLDKSKTYLVHCASGVRSVRACEKLSKLDFPNLYNLSGGYKAWVKAGKPTEQ